MLGCVVFALENCARTHRVCCVGGGCAVVVDGCDGLVVGRGGGCSGGGGRAGRGVDGQPRVGVPPVVGEVHVRLRGKEEGEYSERKSLMVNFGAKLCVLQDGKLNKVDIGYHGINIVTRLFQLY